jgi:hypothetical protein
MRVCITLPPPQAGRHASKMDKTSIKYCFYYIIHFDAFLDEFAKCKVAFKVECVVQRKFELQILHLERETPKRRRKPRSERLATSEKS